MKGISRTAVVVRPQSGEVFEEAIFIVREDYLRTRPDGREALIREAESAAETYAVSAGGRNSPFYRGRQRIVTGLKRLAGILSARAH